MTRRAPGAVVCGVDRSAAARGAASVAAALAHRLGLPLELLHVCNPDDSPERGVIHAVQVALQESEVARVRVESGAVAERLGAASDDNSLVVLGCEPGGAVRDALFGTIADAVSRKAAGPVVVVPNGDRSATLDGRTLACSVRDDRDLAPAWVAARLGEALGLQLVLLGVVPPQPIPTVAGPAIAPSELATPRQDREAVELLLRRVRDRLPGRPRTRVLSGPPGPSLTSAAGEEGAAMLAIGASRRGPLASTFAGSAQRYVSRHAERPVLVCPQRGDG